MHNIIRQLADLNQEFAAPLPHVEKRARREALAKTVPGLDILGVSDVSNALLDKTAGMVATGKLSYIPLESCVSQADVERYQEGGGKGQPCLTLNSTHNCWVGLQRRGFAYQAAGICARDFMEHDLNRTLYGYLVGKNAMDDVVLTWAQLARLDKAIFFEMARRCKDAPVCLTARDKSGATLF